MNYNPPIADGKTIVNKKDAFNTDIIRVLESNFEAGKAQTKKFALNFVGANDEQTANNVWNYLRHKIKYKRDSESRQQIRLPARLIADAATGADCKSFALFACSILANLGFKVGFRYASYTGSSTPTHVYCIATKAGRNYIVDGVWHTFNTEKFFTNKIDHYMQVETLSGFGPRKQLPRLTNPNDPAQLRAFYNKLNNKNTVLAKLVLKRMSPTGTQLNYSPAQLAHYKKVLTKALSLHPNPAAFGHQLIADELTRINSGTITGPIYGEANVINGIAGRKKGKVKKFFKKVGKKVGQIVKKGTLAAPRSAFLGLVRLNFRSLATRLARGRAQDPNKFKSFWKNLGGDVGTLSSVVTAGAKKKPLLPKKGIKGIGLVDGGSSEVVTAIALATPILIIASKLFSKAKGEPDLNTGDIEAVTTALEAAGVDPSVINTVKELSHQAESFGFIDPKPFVDPADDGKGDESTGIDFGGYLPWIAGGALLYFATRKGK